MVHGAGVMSDEQGSNNNVSTAKSQSRTYTPTQRATLIYHRV